MRGEFTADWLLGLSPTYPGVWLLGRRAAGASHGAIDVSASA